MKTIHEHYDKLTITEKQFVDDAYTAIVGVAKEYGIKLSGDDRAELAVDALARLVLESNPGTRCPWQVATDALEQITPAQFNAIVTTPTAMQEFRV